MFKTITRLLFGGQEEAPEDVKSGEAVEDGWLVVSHPEAGSAENQCAKRTDTQSSNLALHGATVENVESDISVLDPEHTVESSSSSSSRAITGSVYQPKAVLEVTQLSSIQRAKTWGDPHHMSRKAIQRQNRVRQGVQHQSFHLQQPGQRNLSH
ncbi:tumor protein p53-inducible nuclear protein 2 isoform 1-T2 [Spinachia spinachia]